MILIRGDKVTYGYGNRTVLEEISFEIHEGDKIALLGKNGSGKSTFIKAINGLLRPKQGVLTRALKEWGKSYESDIYTIFSSPDDQILMPSVYVEVALGLIQQGKTQTEVVEIIEKSLRRFGLSRYIHENPYHLSTGEKKKLLLATAFSLNPALLVLDEPLANLDVKTKHSFAKDIASLSCTQLMSTHEYEYAQVCCKKAFVLHEGKLILFDKITDLLNSDDTMQHYDLI